MEPHGAGRNTTGGEDPAPEWTGSGSETGLDESMWKLELDKGEESYPERPNDPDCLHFLRTGYCGYGSRCRFNHPQDRGKAPAIGSSRPSGGEYPERAGQPVCQYYMRTGTCKFGASCKYNHPKQVGGSAGPVALNYYGYPLRPGEKECSYYMRTGQCKFGGTCKFNHPDPEPVGMHVQAAPPQPQAQHLIGPVNPTAPYPAVQSSSDPSAQQYGVVMRPTVFPGPYIGHYAPVLFPTGVVPVPGGWGPYAAPVSPVAPPGAQPTIGPSSVSGVTQLSASALAYTGPYQTVQSTVGASTSGQKELSFPQRPGQPECQYYMKTGECKYGSSCKYHHPPDVSAGKGDVVVLNLFGLPLRPGAPTCSYYTQHGFCRFGPACKYNHPGGLSHSPSASSLADMPVAPYPVGSVMGALAPSSSSSNLRPELTSGPGKEPTSTKASSSMTQSSESVGLIASSSGSVPQSTVQRSVPITGPSTSSSANDSTGNKEPQTSS